MTASTTFKTLLAGLATVAVVGTAVAQGTPPAPAPNAPIGAGQQSSQGTPMGSTGVASDNANANTGANMGTNNAATRPAMGSGNADSTNVAQAPRPARADRN